MINLKTSRKNVAWTFTGKTTDLPKEVYTEGNITIGIITFGKVYRNGTNKMNGRVKVTRPKTETIIHVTSYDEGSNRLIYHSSSTKKVN